MTLVLGKSSRGQGPLAQNFRFSESTPPYLKEAQRWLQYRTTVLLG